MATHQHVNNEEEGNKEINDNTQIKKNLDGWKFPKISVDQLYKKKILRVFPNFVIKDFEETIPVKATDENVCVKLLSGDVLNNILKARHKFLHLALVQIAITPLMRDGLGGQIVVCLRDARHAKFENSLLALVDSNLSNGPFYFNCFPSFSVSLADTTSLFEVLTLNVKTSGIPLALTYRVVCKAMEDLSSEALKESILGETTIFQPAIGTQTTIKWDEVRVPESWACKPHPEAKNLSHDREQ